MNIIKRSFRAVKGDLFQFKKRCDDWFFFLHNNQENMKARIAALEQQVNELQKKKDDPVVVYTYK
ncbi:hypothetical protein J4460_01165 [Candidatus Woesearchaeota archaeon]|nr:MAG: hypothetical protein QS99_C0001G0048 [archaeon GW2011_AR4]MBS3129261.1 hypothetical protein [Candidatus Woesearchaeota archaeon]HIH38564.1 hypothetical protein [Candidatus Woesearchaeota archaeon]HIH48519.1 hypothetical protein [Candidatus Woesearchaeota archaeon]HIJ02768.1 hypothetical protein [Candidatus Woesearchaeota archaeon]